MKHKKIINSFFLCFGILVLCAPGFSKEVQSVWAATPVSIDGLSDEWTGGTMAKFKSAKIDYAFRNDNENLYVVFIFKEPRSRSAQSGLTGIWAFLVQKSRERSR